MSLPVVPKLQDYRLEEFLNAVRKKLFDLDKNVAVETPSVDASVSGQVLAFDPQWEAPALLADQGIGSEDAWTSIASGAPGDARFALILFEVSATDDGDQGELFWRTGSGSPEIPASIVMNDEDDAQPRIWYPVTLDGSGGFEYKFVNSSATTINWSITRIGYHL